MSSTNEFILENKCDFCRAATRPVTDEDKESFVKSANWDCWPKNLEVAKICTLCKAMKGIVHYKRPNPNMAFVRYPTGLLGRFRSLLGSVAKLFK
jgi:hypothetical protein